MKTGDLYKTKKFGLVEVIEYINSQKIKVRFLTTGFEKHTAKNYILSGALRDPLHPTVAGIGFMGVGEYSSRKHRRVYTIWLHMLKRCYDKTSDKYKWYGAKGVKVATGWHNFQNFASWACARWQEGLVLDKDIKAEGIEKIYSPETCIFIPRPLNVVFTHQKETKGDYPTGVHKYRKRFIAQIATGSGKPNHLGVYDTPEQAFLVYKKEKEKTIRGFADKYLQQGIISRDVWGILINYEVKP